MQQQDTSSRNTATQLLVGVTRQASYELLGGELVSDRTWVGQGAFGRFVTDGGTHRVGDLQIGTDPRGSGGYQLSRGLLAAVSVRVGAVGAVGVFVQNGGVHRVDDALEIGAGSRYLLQGSGELALWAPLVRRFTHSEMARWCAFVAPPFEPFAPAWQGEGARLDRLLVVQARPAESLWALEQCLLSGACALGIAWPQAAGMTELRRLALAAERGAALGVLIRPPRAAREHSAATLRIALTRSATHLRLDLLKGRGVAPRVVEVALP